MVFRPRIVENVDDIIRNKLDVFIPPPVLEDDAPININNKISIMVGAENIEKSTVLKPAVRVVTELKNAPDKFANVLSELNTFPFSKKKMTENPPKTKIRLIYREILDDTLNLFHGDLILLRMRLKSKISSSVVKPNEPKKINTDVTAWIR